MSTPSPASTAPAPGPVPAPPVAVALLGCGAVSRLFYAPALRELERHGLLQVVALADPSAAARAALARQFPTARSVPAAPEALAGAQLAIVATPPRFHREQTEAAFAAGLDVLCEKPLAASAADAAAMVEAAARSGHLLAAGHYKRFMPAHRALKRLIELQTFGPLQTVDIAEGGKFSWPAATDSFFRREQTPGGVFLDIGVHVLDLMLWWLGEPVSFQYADDAAGGLEANCLLRARFPGEVRATVRLSRDWATANTYLFRFARATVHCRVNASNKLELTLDDLPMTLAAELRDPIQPDNPAPTTALETNPQAFIAQLVDVCAAVRDRRAPFVTGAEAAGAVAWIERCYAARTPLGFLDNAPAVAGSA